MPGPLPVYRSAARREQLARWCASCGRQGALVRGRCRPGYAAQGCNRARFARLRPKILARDGHGCRVCGERESAGRPTHIRHRRPGVSRERLLIALCPAHHALIHRLRVLDRPLPRLAAALWREFDPGAPRQLALAFEPAPWREEAPEHPPVWLWEGERAG